MEAKREAIYVALSGAAGALLLFAVGFLWEIFNQPSLRDARQKDQIAELETALQPPPDYPDIVIAKNNIALFASDGLYPAVDAFEQFLDQVAKEVTATQNENLAPEILGLVWNGLEARANRYELFYLMRNNKSLADPEFLRNSNIDDLKRALDDRLMAYRSGVVSLNEFINSLTYLSTPSNDLVSSFRSWTSAHEKMLTMHAELQKTLLLRNSQVHTVLSSESEWLMFEK